MSNTETTEQLSVVIEELRRDTQELRQMAEQSRALLARVEARLKAAEDALGLHFPGEAPLGISLSEHQGQTREQN